eukprot:g4627.t1
MEGLFSRVDFNVIANLGFGEAIRVVIKGKNRGSLRSPSSFQDQFDPDNGIALVTTPECHPMFYTARPLAIDRGDLVHYRYAIFSAGRFDRWEESDIRKFEAKEEFFCVQDVVTTNNDKQRQGEPSIGSSSDGGGTSSSVTDRQFLAIRSSLSNASLSSISSVGGGQSGPGSPTSLRSNSSSIFSTKVVRRNKKQKEIPDLATTTRTSGGAPARSVSPSQKGIGTVPVPVKLNVPYFPPNSHSESQNQSQNQSLLQTSRTGSTSSLRIRKIYDSDENLYIGSNDGVLIVVLYLPVHIKRTEDGQGWDVTWDEDSLLARKKTTIADKLRFLWIGMPRINGAMPGTKDNPHLPRKDRKALSIALRKLRCIPVFVKSGAIDDEMVKLHDEYCRNTLWALFHNVIDVYEELPTRWWNRKDQNKSWRAYTALNRVFSSKIVEVYETGDFIWIQDFHFLVLPSFLVRKLPSASIGLYLYTPFPSSEIFRTLSVRDKLLRGMLNADQLGFPLYEYARHFLACCRRLMGVRHSMNKKGVLKVHMQGRNVSITVTHPGIEPSVIDKYLGENEIQRGAIELQKKYQGKIIFLGIDDLIAMRGLAFKFLAFKRFLENYPKLHGKFVFIQIGLTSRAGCNGNENTIALTRSNLLLLAKEANQICPGAVEFIEIPDISMAERLKYYLAADAMIITSVRESLNTYPIEFVHTRSSGVLIVSEFSGCSRIMPGALHVNPWEGNEIVSAIAKTMAMPLSERKARSIKNCVFVHENTTSKWVQHVLLDLKRSRKKDAKFNYQGMGLGLEYRLMAEVEGFKQLRVDTVCQAWRRSSHRLLLLDLRGTLVPFDFGDADKRSKMDSNTRKIAAKFDSRKTVPVLPEEIREALELLGSNPRNTIFILSGLERAVLKQCIGESDHIGLAAEHGFFYRWPPAKIAAESAAIEKYRQDYHKFRAGAASGAHGEPEDVTRSPERFARGPVFNRLLPSRNPLNSFPPPIPENTISEEEEEKKTDTKVKEKKTTKKLKWETIAGDYDESWMTLAQSIMAVYTHRTDGTCIERKGSALVWLYGNADPDFGALQSATLAQHLEGVLKNFAVDVLSGKNYIEVRPSGVNKGTMAERILNTLERGNKAKIDFILSAGDDISDETMFEALQKRRDENANSLPVGFRQFTCTIGKKPSAAKYFVHDTEDIKAILIALTKVNLVAKRSKSLNNLLNANKTSKTRRSSPLGKTENSTDVASRSSILSPMHRNASMPSFGSNKPIGMGKTGGFVGNGGNANPTIEEFLEEIGGTDSSSGSSTDDDNNNEGGLWM